MAKSTRPGIQVISDSKTAKADILPAMYSAREKGRQKYRGSAPLAKSGEIRPGPVKAVRMKASAPCMSMKKKKNRLSMARNLATSMPYFETKSKLWVR